MRPDDLTICPTSQRMRHLQPPQRKKLLPERTSAFGSRLLASPATSYSWERSFLQDEIERLRMRVVLLSLPFISSSLSNSPSYSTLSLLKIRKKGRSLLRIELRVLGIDDRREKERETSSSRGWPFLTHRKSSYEGTLPTQSGRSIRLPPLWFKVPFSTHSRVSYEHLSLVDPNIHIPESLVALLSSRFSLFIDSVSLSFQSSLLFHSNSLVRTSLISQSRPSSLIPWFFLEGFDPPDRPQFHMNMDFKF